MKMNNAHLAFVVDLLDQIEEMKSKPNWVARVEDSAEAFLFYMKAMVKEYRDNCKSCGGCDGDKNKASVMSVLFELLPYYTLYTGVVRDTYGISIPYMDYIISVVEYYFEKDETGVVMVSLLHRAMEERVLFEVGSDIEELLSKVQPVRTFTINPN